MPELKIPQRQTQSIPQAQPGFGSPVGEAVGQLGATTTQLGEALNTVGKYRAEQAALQADVEFQQVQREFETNPNILLDPKWKEDYDTKVSVIQDKYGKTPLMRVDTFNKKSGLYGSTRKLELEGLAIHRALASGKAAYEDTLSGWVDRAARSKTEEESAIYKQKIDLEVDKAVQNGFILPGEAAKAKSDAKADVLTLRFSQINNNNPNAALTYVAQHENEMTMETSEKLKTIAIQRYAQLQSLDYSIERMKYTRRRQQEKIADSTAHKSLIQLAITTGVTPTDVLNQQSNLNPDHFQYWMTFLKNNPSGELKTPKNSDPALVRELTNQLLGLKAPMIDPETGEEITFFDMVDAGLLSQRLSQSDYVNFMNQGRGEFLDPVFTALRKAVKAVTVFDQSKEPLSFAAEQELRDQISQHPEWTPKDYRTAAKNILGKYDFFDLNMGAPKPDYYVYTNGNFDLDKSDRAVAKDFESNKITRQQMNDRLLELQKYQNRLQAEQIFNQSLGSQ